MANKKTKKTFTDIGKLEVLVTVEAASLLGKNSGESWGISAAKTSERADVIINQTNGSDIIEQFEVLIVDIGPQKIEVIKVIREITDLGLGEVLHFIENKTGRKLIAVGVTVALEAKRRLTEAGAKVEIYARTLAGDPATEAPPPDVSKKKKKEKGKK